MKKFTLITALIAVTAISNLQAQVNGYWEFYANSILRNLLSYNGYTINEFWLQTGNNTRMRLYSNGEYQINARDGVGGVISTPSGQADYATMKIRAAGSSGLVSYSFQNSGWGQNIQSYVGLYNTVSYAVKWNGSDRFYVAGQGWLYANGAWFGSDSTLKTNIQPLKNSLDKVLLLQGHTFQFKKETRSETCDDATSPDFEERTEMGLIAQEVEEVVPEVVRTVDNGIKAVAYQNLVALLIESTKEQQTQIKNLQAQVAKLIAFSDEKLNNGSNFNGTENQLLQNIPNPFNSSTTIQYYLADGINSARIVIFDMLGKVIKTTDVSNAPGEGSITLSVDEIAPSGMYVYGLMVDNQLMDARMMLITQ